VGRPPGTGKKQKEAKEAKSQSGTSQEEKEPDTEEEPKGEEAEQEEMLTVRIEHTGGTQPMKVRPGCGRKELTREIKRVLGITPEERLTPERTDGLREDGVSEGGCYRLVRKEAKRVQVWLRAEGEAPWRERILENKKAEEILEKINCLSLLNTSPKFLTRSFSLQPITLDSCIWRDPIFR
jgi:hypothetical protein